jgi:hypothetical protein
MGRKRDCISCSIEESAGGIHAYRVEKFLLPLGSEPPSLQLPNTLSGPYADCAVPPYTLHVAKHFYILVLYILPAAV